MTSPLRIDMLPSLLADRLDLSESGCWLWTKPTTAKGYARADWNGRPRMIHQVVYEILVGSIPDGLEPDHVCHTADTSCVGRGRGCPHRRCCNPAHLEWVTHAENVRRGRVNWMQLAKTHCPLGHPYDEANTFRVPSRPRQRRCRECGRAHVRARRARLMVPIPPAALVVVDGACWTDA